MKNKLTREDLMAIILCLQKTCFIDIRDCEDLEEIKQVACGTVCILLNLCFGEYNSELIWLYAIGSDKNKFESIDELYNYLLDPYSGIVQKDSALTISQLRQLFPNEEMFKLFEETINKTC